MFQFSQQFIFLNYIFMLLYLLNIIILNIFLIILKFSSKKHRIIRYFFFNKRMSLIFRW